MMFTVLGVHGSGVATFEPLNLEPLNPEPVNGSHESNHKQIHY